VNYSVLLQHIISLFRIQNVYLRKVNDASNSRFKFKIDFDVFNIKLLKL